MQSIPASTLRQNLFSMLATTIRYDEPIVVTTRTGNAVLISEDEYRGLLETQYLNSIPGFAEELQKRSEADNSEYKTLEELGWLKISKS